MSWTLARTELLASCGKQHYSEDKFAKKIASIYHSSIKRHTELITGTYMNSLPQLASPDKEYSLYKGILAFARSNQKSYSNSINLIDQMRPLIIKYWADVVITGPSGFVKILNPGVWITPHIPQNYNFSIWVNAFVNVSRLHVQTLVGSYTSTVGSGFTTPWSGYSLRTF